MTKEAVKEYKMSYICYTGTEKINSLNCLTFVFKDKFAPPANTYQMNPTVNVKITAEIGRVDFGLHTFDYGKKFNLCSLRLYERGTV